MLRPFNYKRISESSFEFTTTAEVVYQASFSDASAYFQRFPGFASQVRTFQFEVIHNPHPILPPEPRVGVTVSYLIHQFFIQEQEGVLFFMHDKSDGKDLGRYRKFESWFRMGANESLAKYNAEIPVGRVTILISILLRKDHPQFGQIISGFDELVLENSEKPDD